MIQREQTPQSAHISKIGDAKASPRFLKLDKINIPSAPQRRPLAEFAFLLFARTAGPCFQ
jgi:hypothetical protein